MVVPVRRALLSVSDKAGLATFAAALQREFGFELLSTGGTAKALRDAGLNVTDVSAVTGFPEMMDGRVKTLHPKIHGGLLALRDNPQHVAAMEQHDIAPIDLVCINLYPFQQTVAKPNVHFEEAIENIDIGGPSMIRSAAKNHRFVAVVTDPNQYETVLAAMRAGGGQLDESLRLQLAQAAFALTSRYDTAIAEYLHKQLPAKAETGLPAELHLHLAKKQDLRYGENPHQKAALYVDQNSPRSGVAHARQLHGKELSYINLLDADAALAAARELDGPAACIVKHATPCGLAVGNNLTEAFTRAYEGDPVAAFGGILAVNSTVDLAAATAMTEAGEGKWFVEVMIAPAFEPEALELLRGRWKNVRLLETGPLADNGRQWAMHRIGGGYLVQEADHLGIDRTNWNVVSARKPTAEEQRDLELAWLACKHVKSNAIVVARHGMMLGSGAGQQDRLSACRLAIAKAAERVRGAVAASDAFFPFADGPQTLLDAGVTAIIQPGGSVRDDQTIAAVDRAAAAMIFTGQRHFRH